MRIAVVAGGWHYPAHFYRSIAAQADTDVDLFCIGHRSPDNPLVSQEKAKLDTAEPTPLVMLDRVLYQDTITEADLLSLGWNYHEAPNTIGDWGFLNQWLDIRERVGDFEDYSAILFAHDDTFIRRRDLFHMIRGLPGAWGICLWTNGRYQEAPEGYARGSFEIWTPELICELGGRIPMADTGLSRVGLCDSPEGLEALSAWNANGEPTRQFMNRNGLKVGYLSEYYRVSHWAIEGERGFLHNLGGAPWSYNAGLAALGVIS